MGIAIQSIKLDNITFAYEGRSPIFENLEFAVPNDPVVWLHGEIGMGKSSLLKILAGLVTPQSGRYLINGVDVLEMSFREFLPYRFVIGYSFDSGGLLVNRTLSENLMLPLMFHQRCSQAEAAERVSYWIKRFNLEKVADQRPYSVTGSQRKATIVLRAFIHYPQFVLLDDPMTGLKEDVHESFVELIEECAVRHGLKHILFCGEEALPIKKIGIKKMSLSHQPKPKSGAA